MRRFIVMGLLIGVASVLGCSDAKMPTSMSERGSKDKKGMPRLAREEAARDGAVAGVERPDGAVKHEKAEKAEKATRKIVYTGDISLVVEDFDVAAEKLEGILALHEGAYIARSEITGEPNMPRRGTWTIRVPAEKGTDFRKDLVKLGEPRKSSLDSRDITDEYFDTRAAIKNMEAEQEGIRKLYERVNAAANPKYSELMEVKRELNRVTREIEIAKGRIQRWDKEVEFTTFTLTMMDRRGYIPPESPAFTSRIGRTFSGSLELMLDFGKAIVLIAVAVGPWLAILAVPMGLLWWSVRRQGRSPVTSTRKPPPPMPDVEVLEEVPNQRGEEGVTGRE